MSPAPSRSKLAFDAQYRLYRDFGDDHNLEIGVSYGRGFNGVTTESTTELGNAHLVYRWKPLRGRPYRSFILRSEFFLSRREQEGPVQKGQGFYVGGDYQLSKYWYERALAADPVHVKTWQYYGMWQVEQGNMLKAADFLEKIKLICGTECKEYQDLKGGMEGTVAY